MSYQKPELFLVGAAKGLVLGGRDLGSFKDHDGTCGNAASRNDDPCV